MADVNDRIQRIRRSFFERAATADSQSLPKARLRYEPPRSVLNQSFQLPGHGLIFCVHGKSYFEPCSATTCRRTKREADARLKAFLEAM